MSVEKTHNVDLLIEVVDALLHPSFDCDRQGQHASAIDVYLRDKAHDAASEELRVAAKLLLSRSTKRTDDFIFEDNSTGKETAERLKERLPRWPYYLYHGTVASNLPSIAEFGLQPALGRPVWKKFVGPEHLERGVFFTTSWRTAINWASVHTTGDDGEYKEGCDVAVVRVLAEPLTYSRDTHARMSDCVVVEGRVSVIGSHYIEGLAPDFPEWQPLTQSK
ncbi:hypothetical protein [uncultured Roseibium sp.]|uniref:hypothetical protein n=1 Tax=uncultured Roseibium sp. TaxID=1936171 RepID=UPI002596E2A3|nr:hypothetical protein [uncultured Roseibium sp.]